MRIINDKKKLFLMVSTTLMFNFLLYTRLLRMLELPIPTYLIEFVVIIMAVLILIDFIKKPYWCKDFLLVIILLVLTLGTLSVNLNNDLKDRFIPICMDIYICWRFLIILFFGIRFSQLFKNYYKSIEKVMVWSARVASIVYLCVSGILYLSHSSWNLLSACIGEMVMIMCVLLLSTHKIDILFMISICLAQFSTEKMIAYGVIVVFILIVLYKWILQVKYNIPILIASILGVISVGFADFNGYYLGNNNSVRLHLMNDALILAKKQVPLGSGFATFCSQASLKWISPLYKELDIESLEGCSLDAFWACVLGQFGFLGVGLVIGVFIIFLLMCFKQRKNPSQFASMYLCVCFFVIYSLGGNSIFTAASIVFFVFGFAYSYENDVIIQESNEMIER